MGTTKAEHDERMQEMLIRLFSVAELLVNLPERDGNDEPTDEQSNHLPTAESAQNARAADADV